MATTLSTFTPLEDSLWLTLCARAVDNRSPHPILGDAMADEIVRTLDYDYAQLHMDSNLILNVALRARKLDQVASEFLARNPDAVGLDLGAGLDTRFERLAPPAGIDWYDVDFPAVAAARQRLIPEHPNGHLIGADVRDPGWLDTVPTGRPAVIVADGLMGFLTQDEMVSLLNRFMGLLSVVAGAVVLVYPGISLVTLAVVLGFWLLVYGAMEVAMAFQLRSVGRAAAPIATTT